MNNRIMIVTDLDGTLLKNDKTVSDYTKQVIKKVQENGDIFAIATARPIRAAKKFLSELKYDIGIYHNGAVIQEGTKTLGNYGINEPKRILDLFIQENENIRIAVECNDVLYSNFDADEFWPGTTFQYTSDFMEIKNLIADKIIIEVKSLDDMNKYGKRLPDDLYIQMSENKIGMIMNKKATKLDSILYVARMNKIDVNDIYVFGDDYNDLDMLSFFKKGIAVSNSLEDVKLKAKYICDSNENDGVAKWIEKNILKKGE